MHLASLLRGCAKIEMIAMSKYGVAAGLSGLDKTQLATQQRSYRASHVVQATAAPSTGSVSKTEFVKIIQSRVEETLGSKVSKASAALVVDAVFDTIVDEVSRGNKVAITGFGSFEPRLRAARNGRNPATGESIHIPSSTVPAFTAGKAFKDQVKASHK